MHVCIVNLTNGGLSGGYRKYLEVVEPLLRADPRVSRLTVFSPPAAGTADDAGHLSFPADDRWRGHRWLKARLRALAPDVVFFPTAARVDCGDTPTVVMVRNMEPLLVPFGGNTLADGLKNVVRRHVARTSCERATRVIAVSGYVRDFVTGRWGIDPARVGVVYHGVGEPVPAPVRPQAVAGDAPFLFTAGSIRPARGLEDAIGALALAAARGARYRLVIGGSTNPGSEGYQARMRRLARELGVADRVVWAGQLGAAQMAWCFGHCAAFVMTSRAEACPNTVLEAMRHGAVSLSTDHPPMPEFFAGTALLYRGRVAGSLAERVVELAGMDGERRAALRRAARARAGDFTWGATVSGTVRELLAASGAPAARPSRRATARPASSPRS